MMSKIASGILYQPSASRGRIWEKVKIFLEMIKFEHTIFALPFAYIAALLAVGGVFFDLRLLWITLAMAGGRTTAMALNRIIDRYIDAENPRTQSRALPAGQLQVAEVWLYTAISALVFLGSAAMLTPLSLTVAPFCLAAFLLYSYTKRFTWGCHYVLGLTIGLAPLSAWIAITNSVSAGISVLSVGVALWVAGFDIIYACSDYAFDKQKRLYSIPACFGIERALVIAAISHALAVLVLAIAGKLLACQGWYWLGLLATSGLMYKQHHLLKGGNLDKLQVAFFNLNGTISMLMFSLVVLDLVTR